MFTQHPQDLMASSLNRATPPAYYYLPSASAPLAQSSESISYENLQQNTFLFSHHSNPSSTANSPLLHNSSCSSTSSPLLSGVAPQSTIASNTQDFLNASENDPYFIPVQGIMPPTKNMEGRYECQLCDRSYTHAKHLKRHMMRHTGQKPYGCTWCSARFTRPDIRKRHVSKCKVRRKIEGLECIKIEEENPAKMISLKNKKMNERKAKKLAEAKASAANAAQIKLEEASVIPSFSSPMQDLPIPSITPPISSLNGDFDPSLIDESIKKDLESVSNYMSTPTMSCHDLPHQLPPQHQQQQLPSNETIYFSSMPTPVTMPSVVSGYMTPTESSPIFDFQHRELKSTEEVTSLDHQNMCYYLGMPSTTPMNMYYDETMQQHHNQPLYQPQMLTPQQYEMSSSQQHSFFNESACMYGESPLETFVPPVYDQ